MNRRPKGAGNVAGPGNRPPAPASLVVDGSKLRQMEVDEFVRRLKLEDQNQEKKFALFLGAGCSVSSGIPAAGTLVKDRWLPRLRDIRAPHEADHETWAERTIPGYKKSDPAASYGYLIDELFVTPDDRQREIESLCDGRSPAFGYAVLAQLVARTNARFNIVLTTNFDDLVADALYLFTDSRPLVIQHESLAAFIRPTRTRPLVVKLHGDHRLAPRNTLLETAALEAEIARHTAMVLNDRGLVFMGYGGNDKGIQRLLSELPHDALPFGAYWVHPQEPAGAVREWLVGRNGVWVKSGWFDEVMLLARNIFALPHPEPNRFTRIFADYQDEFQKLSSAIAVRSPADAGTAALKQAVEATEQSFPDFWKALSEALRLAKTDRAEAEKVYLAGIAQFPQAVPLLGNYALFLMDTPGRRDEAEVFHKRAIQADPKDAKALVNYAGFLMDTPGRRGEAEAFYTRAIEADPKDANALGNYAVFLVHTPGRRDEAEAFFKRAIEADPKRANNLGNYGVFLEQTPGRRDEAEAFFKRAIAADPKDANNLRNYAVFLEQTPGRRDKAETFFKRAVAADPKDANALGNYADFLHTMPGREVEAEPFYRRALDANPMHAFSLHRYADFLEEVRKDTVAAKALRARAAAAIKNTSGGET
jgi:Tfp pilus assembly protein PilF